MLDRIQKILSARGVSSRRAAEKLISEGKVKVNGFTVTLGDRADPDKDEITVNDVPIPAAEERIYIMLNKPRGYVTTMSDEKGRKTVAQLVTDVGVSVYPVGRLDINSEGLLIMTNDGEFANLIMHPSHEKNKTYHVTVTGDVKKALSLLTLPMLIDDYMTKPAKAEIVGETLKGTIIAITIHEGRNRQIRKMCNLAGLEVKQLKRVSIGSLKLDNLKTGEWRRLCREDLQKLLD